MEMTMAVERRALPYLMAGTLVFNGRVDRLQTMLLRHSPLALCDDPRLGLPWAATLPLRGPLVRDWLATFQADDTTLLPDGTTPRCAARRLLTAFGLLPIEWTDADLVGPWGPAVGSKRWFALMVAGDLAGASRELAALDVSARRYAHADAIRLAGHALLELRDGRPSTAARTLDAARARMTGDPLQHRLPTFLVDAVGMELARRRGDIESAVRLARTTVAKAAMLGDSAPAERAWCLAAVRGLYEFLGFPVDGPSTESGARAVISRLTAAELRVLHYLPSHLTLGQIARELGRGVATVKTQTGAVYRKLGVRSRHDAVRVATRAGLVPERAAG